MKIKDFVEALLTLDQEAEILMMDEGYSEPTIVTYGDPPYFIEGGEFSPYKEED